MTALTIGRVHPQRPNRNTGAIAELRRLFELQTDYRDIVLELKDVSLRGNAFFGRIVKRTA